MKSTFELEIEKIEQFLTNKNKSNHIIGLSLISQNNDFISYFTEEFVKDLQYSKFTNNYKYKVINNSEPLFYEDFTKVTINILNYPLITKEHYCRGNSDFVEDNGLKLELIYNDIDDVWIYKLEDNKQAFDILRLKIYNFLKNKDFLNQ